MRKHKHVASMKNHTREELAEAIRAMSSLISKCKKVLKKFSKGTPQHTLLENRTKALQISLSLLRKAFKEC